MANYHKLKDVQMKRLAGLAAAATVVLAGCGTTGTPAASTSAAAAAHTSAPPTCHQQYETWKIKPVLLAAKKKLAADQTALNAAVASSDMLKLAQAIKALGQVGAVMAANPMPACADPKGYWVAMDDAMVAGADNAKAGGSGLGGLLLAEVPLKTLKGMESKLPAELKANAGVS
jgi:hypothetical protein